MNFDRWRIIVSKEVKCEKSFFSWSLNFYREKQRNVIFHVIEELVFFDLWIPDSEFRIPNSRF